MKSEGLGGKPIGDLDRGDHASNRRALRPLQLLFARVEIPYDLEHEGTGEGISVMPHRTDRRQVPTPPGPDRAVGGDGDVLRDVLPTLFLGVVAPHPLDRRDAAIVCLSRTPGVMDVHHGDAALGPVARDHQLKLVQRQGNEVGTHKRLFVHSAETTQSVGPTLRTNAGPTLTVEAACPNLR